MCAKDVLYVDSKSSAGVCCLCVQRTSCVSTVSRSLVGVVCSWDVLIVLTPRYLNTPYLQHINSVPHYTNKRQSSSLLCGGTSPSLELQHPRASMLSLWLSTLAKGTVLRHASLQHHGIPVPAVKPHRAQGKPAAYFPSTVKPPLRTSTSSSVSIRRFSGNS